MQHDPVNHQGRRNTERDYVGKRIELPAKGTLIPAKPGKTAVEQIEDAGEQDQPDGSVELAGRSLFCRHLFERITGRCRRD